MSLKRAIEGHQLGRYRLLERLAVGGMAEVFLAIEQSELGVERLVVIKAILPQHGADESFLAMFRQEARLGARVQHPNVVQLYELGEAEGAPYIVMEYVPGLSLHELQRAAQGSAMPVGVAVRLVVQACAGAHAAHELQDLEGRSLELVHRDLTPHNLLVTRSGHLKILDFGIAKARVERQVETRTGVIKGKFPYMSPEQVREEPLDRRSDVFTLGIVLYELLAGDSLFGRSSDLSTMHAVLSHAVPPLLQVRPQVPPSIAAVVDLALGAGRDTRYASTDAFARALLEAAAKEGVDTRQEPTQDFIEAHLGSRLREREAKVAEQVGAWKQRQHAEASERRAREEAQARAREAALAQERRRRERRRWMGVAAVLAAAAVGVAVVGVVGVGGLVWWHQRAPSVAGEPLRIALTPSLGVERLQEDMAPLAGALERATGRPVVLVAGESYEATAAMLLDGRVGYAFLAPYLYVRTAAKAPGLEPLAFKVIDGAVGTDGVLLVAGDAGLASLADARGHTICYSDLASTTGWLLPRAALRAAGVDPDRELTTVVSGNHLQMLKDLTGGRCQLGGTFTTAMLSADALGVPVNTTRVLAVTGRTPNDVLVRGPASDDASAQLLQQALLAFDPERDLGGKRVGDLERISGFVRPDPEAFADIQRAVESEARAKAAGSSAPERGGPPPGPNGPSTGPQGSGGADAAQK